MPKREIDLDDDFLANLDSLIEDVNRLASVDWSSHYDELVTLRDRIEPYPMGHELYSGRDLLAGLIRGGGRQ